MAKAKATSSADDQHEDALVLQIRATDGGRTVRFSRTAGAGDYDHLPAVGDRVGIEGIAITGLLVMRTFWEKTVHLDVDLDLPRNGWTLENLSEALVELGFRRI